MFSEARVASGFRETHLLDLGDVADEGLVVDELQQLLQLVKVTDEVLSDLLINTSTLRRELLRTIGSCPVPPITVSVPVKDCVKSA